MLQCDVDGLWHILIAALSDSQSSNTFCVFDGLDECDRNDQGRLIKRLKDFYIKTRPSTEKGWLKFLITSRPYDEINEEFRSFVRQFPQIHLIGEEENDAIHTEINVFVKIKVAELAESCKLKPTTRNRIEQQLLNMNNRTYLWLHLAVADIRTTFTTSLRPEEEAICLIPESVHDAYTRILDRVPHGKEQTVRKILEIIVGATRPLNIAEMAMALGIATTASLRSAAEMGLSPEGLDDKIRQLCGLFVFVNDSKIYPIHQTAREFLMNNRATESSCWKWRLDSGSVESTMAHICARYLTASDVQRYNPGINRDTPIFIRYATENWRRHYQNMFTPLDIKPIAIYSVILRISQNYQRDFLRS